MSKEKRILNSFWKYCKKLASQLFSPFFGNESIMLTSRFFGFFTDRIGIPDFWTFLEMSKIGF